MSSPSWGYFVALRLFLPLSIAICSVYVVLFLFPMDPLASPERAHEAIWSVYVAIWSVYVVLCLFPGDPLAACHDISWHDKVR
ncbi:hypothetical protein T484DRAFT_1785381 [Baffinella frigidus]|nr:hypothetical protein T484DRAFT_1785381 [Cryptophyta sp. CCMP2293]